MLAAEEVLSLCPARSPVSFPKKDGISRKRYNPSWQAAFSLFLFPQERQEQRHALFWCGEPLLLAHPATGLQIIQACAAPAMLLASTRPNPHALTWLRRYGGS
jgi:hypothetical protein